MLHILFDIIKRKHACVIDIFNLSKTNVMSLLKSCNCEDSEEKRNWKRKEKRKLLADSKVRKSV